MMEKDWRELFHDGELAVLTLLRWVVIGGLTGLACGLAGGAFSRPGSLDKPGGKAYT